MARYRIYVGHALVALSLVFVASACGGNEETVQETRPETQGQRGESCRARNDCVDGLACINNTCVQNEYPIAPNARSCELIECTVNGDCCDDVDTTFCAELEAQCPRLPAYTSNCAQLETACADGAGDFEACNEFNSLCGCFEVRRDCNAGDTFACEAQEFQCVTTFECSEYLSECSCVDTCNDSVCQGGIACFVDDDCFGGTCVAGVCDFRCETDEECGEGEQCIAGACTVGCTERNDCGVFQDCINGTCADVGCTTDRECAAFTDDALATCVSGECVVPCLNDAECNGSGWNFQACVDGTCQYVGCETNEECYLAFTFEGFGLEPGQNAVCVGAE